MRDGLDMTISEEELHRAVRHGECNKSPGTDKICLEFYRAYWEHIKSDMMDIYTKMSEEVTIKQEQLQDLLVCVPKLQSATDLRD